MWATQQRWCCNGHYYYEIENVGSWRCRQHALEYDQKEKLWPCCGASSAENHGCVDADHRPFKVPLTLAQTIHNVPAPVSRLMGARPGNMGGGTYVRLDVQAQNRIRADPAHSTEREIHVVRSEIATIAPPTTVAAAFRRLKWYRDEGELTRNTETFLLWDGEDLFQLVTGPIHQDLGIFIFQKTETSIALKVAETRTVPVEIRDGVPGIPYYESFLDTTLTWTPLTEVQRVT